MPLYVTQDSYMKDKVVGYYTATTSLSHAVETAVGLSKVLRRRVHVVIVRPEFSFDRSNYNK